MMFATINNWNFTAPPKESSILIGLLVMRNPRQGGDSPFPSSLIHYLPQAAVPLKHMDLTTLCCLKHTAVESLSSTGNLPRELHFPKGHCANIQWKGKE